MKSGVIVFAFGAPATIGPNKVLAGWAATLGMSMFTQNDIDMKPWGLEWQTTRDSAEEPGKPPSSFRLAYVAVKWARYNQIDNLIVVAADPHRKRAVRDVQAAIEECGGGITVSVFEGPKVDNWFDAGSTQARTRSPLLWRLREFALWRMPLLIYKAITL